MRRPKPKPKPIPDSDPAHHNMDHPLSLKPTRSPKPTKKPNLLLLPISLLLSLLLFLLLWAPPSHTKYGAHRYSIIIDAGSTGTRVHVFRYLVNSYGGGVRYEFGEGVGHWSMRLSPGLSSYEGDPEGAGGGVRELMEYAKGKVPEGEWGETEVRLMGTAGLRLVQEGVRGRILEACRGVLRRSGFRFRDEWVSVISGSDEGLYAWVVANYALGTLGGDPHQTVGIIELGGASAQVTFVSRESVPPEFSRTLKYGNSTYNLYSNSLLHFGQNVAFDSLKDLLTSRGLKFSTGSPNKELTIDPCTPKGYAQNANLPPDSSAQKYSSTFHAMGNFSECRAAALKLLRRGIEGCPYDYCNLGATFMPKLHGRFLATENFFHTSQFFGLSPKSLLTDMMAAGRQFCEEDWSNIRKKYSPHEEEDLLPYCFSSAYIVALLHDSLGIALDDGRIGYTNQAENVPLDWALGAFILQTSGPNDEDNRGWISSIIIYGISNLFWLVGVAILLLLVACYVSRWRKPYFKTIYDLEKGRYIVTRISK